MTLILRLKPALTSEGLSGGLIMPMLRVYARFIRLNLAIHTIDDEDLLQERKIADLFSRETKELRDVH